MHAKLRQREGAEPERNALRSRGCPNPDRALVRRTKVTAAPRAHKTPTVPALPIALRVENVRRHWQNAVSETRRLKAAGQDFTDAALKARTLRYELVALDPDLGIERRTIAVSQGSDVNPVKAV